jgi:hypothetical protein
MTAITKSQRTKKRKINKAVDRRMALRNQRAPFGSDQHGRKSLMDLPDTPRRPRARHGPRKIQLGETLSQRELADRDPVRDGGEIPQ